MLSSPRTQGPDYSCSQSPKAPTDALIPIVYIVVLSWWFDLFYIKDPQKVPPKKGTTTETIGRVLLLRIVVV